MCSAPEHLRAYETYDVAVAQGFQMGGDAVLQ